MVRVGEASYSWEHDDWLRHRLRDLIIYEMHFGDFTAEGTFASATEKLGHLADLGISAIELMPVYEAAPDDYWGYEPTFLLAPRRSYGSPDDLRRFVDAAHAQHMAVILDMVLAHTGHEHPFNRMYPYEHSPWYGSGLGEDNQYGLPTFNYLKEPTNFFVRDVESHDDQRLQQVLQEAGFDDATILKKSMLAATILMTIPGEPMLYQGQEWGEASPARTEKNTINWQTAQTEPGEALLAHHQRMTRIRRSRSSMGTISP